jgi:uncharacterized Zn finger protein (UPF0148 family)
VSQLTCPRCGSEDLESYELTGHADGAVTCPYCPVEAASVDAASWTPDAAPLTEAEKAAAQALQDAYLDGMFDPADDASGIPDAARAVVAAVRPNLENDGAVKALTAAASEVETLTDALSITKGTNFTGAVSGLQRALSILRRRSTRFAALSLPTAEETPDA